MNTLKFAEPKVGFDIGNVILSTDTYTDTAIEGNKLSLIDLPQRYTFGAIDALRSTVEKIGAENVHIISKCGERMQQKTTDYFNETDFFDRTGVLVNNLWYVRRRYDKAPIAAKLALTHFVDDRAPILGTMKTVPVRILFQRPNSAEPIDKSLFEPNFLVARDWGDVMDILGITI